MRGEREREGVERKQENRCWGGKIIAHTVLRLGFSSRTELEWDFSKWLTQQAGAVFPLFWPTLCFVNIMLAGSAFSRFTANTSSLQDDNRQTGNSWLDGSGCAASGDG